VGPFCVPCGKRFAKQTVYDAHLSGKKHLAALQRMGRDEEAMVCQLDVEAKRRKIAAAEEAKLAVAMPGVAKTTDAESEAAAAARLAAREEKLRERALLPMPTTVAATSVYGEAEPSGDSTEAGGSQAADEGASAAKPQATQPTVTQPTAVDLAAEAAAASGASMAYTSGMQDTEQRVNRHTTPGIAAAHRALAVPRADWFNPQPSQ